MNVYYTKTIKSSPFIVTFSAEEEFSDYTDQFDNKEDVKYIHKKLNSGEFSAWFCAKVEVQIEGTDLRVYDYLGCCSYEKFGDFLIGGNFLDMVNELIDRVKKQKEQLNSVNLDTLFILQGEIHA